MININPLKVAPVSWKTVLINVMPKSIESLRGHLLRQIVLKKNNVIHHSHSNVARNDVNLNDLWLISAKVPSELFSSNINDNQQKHMIMLVEPCSLLGNQLPSNAIIYCLSLVTYFRLKNQYSLGEVLYVSDPLWDLPRHQVLELNSHKIGGESDNVANYDEVILKLMGDELVTWINPNWHLRNELSRFVVSGKLRMKWNSIDLKVLLLQRDPLRVAHVKGTLLPKLGAFQVEVVSAVDGANGVMLKQILQVEKIRVNSTNQVPLRNGQIACALSHYRMWKKFYDSRKSDFMIVLEDDADLVDSGKFIEDVTRILSEVPFYFDWIYLYIFPKHYSDSPSLAIEGCSVIVKGYFTYCTVGYVISRQGAKKLCAVLREGGISMPIDTMISTLMSQHKLNVFCSKSVLVKNLGQETSALNSGTGSMKSNIWNSRVFN